MKNKAHINVSNIHGNTPLHYACFHRYLSVAKYLIENQALLFVANRYGQTPLDLCSSREMSIQLNGLLDFLVLKSSKNRLDTHRSRQRTRSE